MTENNRIAKNTLLLYIRMMIVMIINLYAIRLIIRKLGVEDYGIYNVIAGVVTSLSCITSVLSTSTQRFYSIAQGKGDIQQLRLIYSTSLRINSIIIFVLLIVAETFGLWFINTQLVISEGRMIAANFVYQSALISFIAAFLQTPFSAAIIAHENMGLFAFITLGECLLKFGVAVLLFVVNFDSLVAYSALLAVVSLIILFAFVVVCRKKYIECRYSKYTDKKLRNQMLSFSGWTLLTACASICMYQANTILVNMFFGPVVNASRGIALQINASLSSFTGSFLTAVRSPIMKLYAENKHQELNKLFNISNKFIFYFMLMISIPLFLEMDTIIKLWLNQENKLTVLFSRLTIVYGLILALNNPISYIVQATGKVKQYCLSVEIFTILAMPATFLAYKLGFEASSTFYVMIVCVSLSHVSRLICLKLFYPQISLYDYLFDFMLRAFIVSLFVITLCFYLHNYIEQQVMRLIYVISSSCILTLSLGYVIGLSGAEKQSVKVIIEKIKKRNVR
jgi:O-antigen/teichoic acid export membrane protein